jgi:hypothetical protein
MDSLYDTDLFLWATEQASALRAMARERSNAPVDWEHVAEEIESLGISDRRALGSHVATLLEHLMKLEASSAVEPRGGWEETVLRTRRSIRVILTDSPSLKRLLPDIIAAELPEAKELVVRSLTRHGEQARKPVETLDFTEDQILGGWLP